MYRVSGVYALYSTHGVLVPEFNQIHESLKKLLYPNFVHRVEAEYVQMPIKEDSIAQFKNHGVRIFEETKEPFIQVERVKFYVETDDAKEGTGLHMLWKMSPHRDLATRISLTQFDDLEMTGPGIVKAKVKQVLIKE